MTFRMKLTGLEGVNAALAELPKATSKNVVKRALIDAAEPMADDAAAHAARASGTLAQSITTTASIVKTQAGDSRRPGRDEVRAFVGPNYQRGGGKKPRAPHAHLVEFGTGPRWHKSGKFVGQAPAQPFMRPAFDGGKSGFIERFSRAMLDQIDRAKARLARKFARRR